MRNVWKEEFDLDLTRSQLSKGQTQVLHPLGLVQSHSPYQWLAMNPSIGEHLNWKDILKFIEILDE